MFPWQIMTKCQKVSKWSENTACVRAIFNTLLWKEHSYTYRVKQFTHGKGSEKRKIKKKISTIVTIII